VSVKERQVTGTIISTTCEGLCANIKLDQLIDGKRYAVIDDRTAGRNRLLEKSGGELKLDTLITIMETRKIGGVMVITSLY
jgi:hypothetical protein